MRDLTIEALPYEGERYEKAWGHELWIINNELYCGKLLVFKKDKQFSMHFHLLKDEAWYISKGRFLYKYIDTETATEKEMTVEEGDCIHLNARTTTSNVGSYRRSYYIRGINTTL